MLRFSFGPYFVLVFRLGRCMYGSIKSAGLNQSCRSKAKFAFLSYFFREMRLALNVFVVVFLQYCKVQHESLLGRGAYTLDSR